MSFLKSIPGTIIAILGVALMAVFAVFFGIYLIAAIISMLVLFLMVWAAGAPISISDKTGKIGYIRWFTFHRK